MPKKKKQSAEFRFYEIPQNEPVLALMGDKWIQVYGKGITNLHFHNLLEIGICHYGEGELVINDDTYRFGPGMISCIPANMLHVTRSDEDVPAFWEFMYIDVEKFVKEWSGKDSQDNTFLLDEINRNAFFVNAIDFHTFDVLVKTIFDEMGNRSDYYRECVNGLVYTLLHEIARYNSENSAEPRRRASSLQLEKAIQYVEKQYPSEIRIADLASECNMSETHFRRIFQEKMNMTPVEYINFVRVKKACELIDKTDISMEEVAERVGFVTPSTFNRNFRRVIGTSPYQWKKRPENHEGKLLDYNITALKGW